MDRSYDNPLSKGRKLHWMKESYEKIYPLKKKNLKNEIKMIWWYDQSSSKEERERRIILRRVLEAFPTMQKSIPLCYSWDLHPICVSCISTTKACTYSHLNFSLYKKTCQSRGIPEVSTLYPSKKWWSPITANQSMHQ